MKPSDFVKYGAGLAFNTAYNYIKPNSQEPIGSQIQAYRDMKFYMKRRQGSRTRTVVKRRRKGGRGGGGGGGIIGPPIPRPVKPSGPSMYEKKGSYGQDETYGTISKPEIAYIGFTSAKTSGVNSTRTNQSVSGSILYHAAAALLRHILKAEYKEDVNRHDQLLNPIVVGSTVTNKKSPVIYFIYRNAPLNGTVPTYAAIQIPLLNGSTLRTTFGEVAFLISEAVLSNNLMGGTVDALTYHTNTLYGYCIGHPDSDGGVGANANNLTSGIRRLDTQYIHCYSTCDFMVQNNTVADATADVSGVRLENRIDANPLDCAFFKFNTCMPRVRYDGLSTTGSTNVAGISVAQAALGPSSLSSNFQNQLAYDTNGDGVIVPAGAMHRDWLQLPEPGFFYNCTGSNRFKLAPGEIRRMKLKFKFDGTLQNFIRGFATLGDNSNVRYNGDDSLGTSCLFAFEKIMSTGTDTNVSINYQVSYFAGCYVKNRKNVELMRSYNHAGVYDPALGTWTPGGYHGGVDAVPA